MPMVNGALPGSGTHSDLPSVEAHPRLTMAMAVNARW